jgi:phosphoglycolate phosphatase
MERIRHVIWDWNGTLFDDAQLCWEICREMVSAQGGGPLSFEDFRERFCIPVEQFWHSLMQRRIPREEFLEIGETFHKIYLGRRKECSLHESAESVLKLLADRGVTHSILSSHPQAYLESGVEFCGVGHYFELLTGHPAEGGSSKVPLGETHLKKLRFMKDEIALIGDTVHDYELAQVLGVPAVLFSGGAQAVSRLRATSAPIIDHLSELLELTF